MARDQPRDLAAERARDAESAHRAFARIMAQPCPVHDAEPGQPCWPLMDSLNACGARVTAQGFPPGAPAGPPRSQTGKRIRAGAVAIPELHDGVRVRAAAADAQQAGRAQRRHGNRHQPGRGTGA